MDRLTVSQLRSILREAGVPGYSNKRKNELIDMIIDNKLVDKANKYLNVITDPMRTPRITIPVIPTVQQINVPTVPQITVPRTVPTVPQITVPRTIPTVPQIPAPVVLTVPKPQIISPRTVTIPMGPRVISQISEPVGPPPLPEKPAPLVSPKSLPQQRIINLGIPGVPEKIDYTLPFQTEENIRINGLIGYPNIPGETEELTKRTLARLRPIT